MDTRRRKQQPHYKYVCLYLLHYINSIMFSGSKEFWDKFCVQCGRMVNLFATIAIYLHNKNSLNVLYCTAKQTYLLP